MTDGSLTRTERTASALYRLLLAFAATAAVAFASMPLASAGGAAPAAPEASATAKPGVVTIPIILARERIDRLPPLSLLDQRPADDGLGGAKLAIDDNNTTGRFMKQAFVLDVVENADPAALIAAVTAK